jgi:predicted TIM-barrel fold metal-dependent hydrolase
MMAVTSAEAFGMWILGGVVARFPDLKLVFVEPGLGWVAWWLDVADDMVRRQGYRFDLLDDLPSTYFHRNVFLTFMEERRSIEHLRDRIGVGNILWASDYPHPPTTWPNSRRSVEEQFAGVPAEERALMTGGNAARVWNLSAS